ncbi:MAG: hypothetical protein K9M54_03925 [Kiritimatiellales bacterium]|nr:hypothetical protein [Kiritimatiellales bacterium]MCF7863990.1 hypothetical protein [Kiritimatiellales bacterium]
MKSHIVAWALVALLAQPALAETRIWTSNVGSQLKAELVKETGDKVVLRDETGRELRVSRSYLSPDDIEYLDSRILPVLGLKSDIKVESVVKTGLGVVQVVDYSIEVRQIGSEPYVSPVNVVLYLIGMVGDNKAYVVLQRTQEQVRFTAEQRNPKFSGPSLSLGSPEIRKRNGVEYLGYLITVSTPGGQIIEVKSDHELLEANAGFISKFNAGDLFGPDMMLIK